MLVPKTKFIQPKAIKIGEFTPPDVERLYGLIGREARPLTDLRDHLTEKEARLMSLMDFGTPSPLPWAGSGIVVEPNDPQTIQRRSESRADKWHADYDSSRTTAFHRVRVASFPYGTRYLLPGEVPGLERALQLPPHQAAEFIIGDEGQVIIASAIDRGDVAVNQVKPGEVLEFPEMLLHRAPTSEERNGLRAFVRSSA